MANQTPIAPEAADLRRLLMFIGVSVVIHVVILVGTSVPYIMRGFRPAGVPAVVEPEKKPVSPQVSSETPSSVKPAPSDSVKVEETVVTPAKKPAAKPVTPSKPAAKGPADKKASAKPAVDPDAAYFKDEKLSPTEMRKGPDLDTGLDAK